MKYLGIDYGKKKIGIAKSDEMGSIAFPDRIIAPQSDNTHIDTILDLCRKEDIHNIVIGHSIDFQGKDNPIEKSIKEFISAIISQNENEKESSCAPIIIHRFDERMSTSGTQAMLRHSFQKNTQEKYKSQNAKKVREHTKNDDAQVAAYILQGFLDMKGRV